MRATDDEYERCIDSMSVTVVEGHPDPTDASTDAPADVPWEGQPDMPAAMAPVCYILLSHDAVPAGEPLGLQAVAKDPDGGAVLAYEWDLDHDGASFMMDSSGHFLAYTYATPGGYTVALRVVDDEGQSATTTTEVVVLDPGEETTEPSPDTVEDAFIDAPADPPADVSYGPPGGVNGGCGCMPI